MMEVLPPATIPNVDLSTELRIVEKPEELTPMEQAFCIAYCQGGGPVAAYRAASSVYDELLGSRQTVERARRLMGKDHVRKYIRLLQDKMEEIGVLSLAHLQIFLSAAITTPIGDVDENHILAQEVTYHYDNYGIVKRKTVKMVPKLPAGAMLAKMRGWDAPTEVNVNHTMASGVMIVPMASDRDDWEKLAAESQKKLQDSNH